MCQTIDVMKPQLSETLKGTGISTERFIATAKTAVQTHVQKDRLASADKQSLYLAIKKSASDGLMPDNRESALVIYGNQVQYQPMVQGLVKLARNSGEIESIGAYIVYSEDEFIYRVGVDKLPQHQAGGERGWFSSDRGEPVGVWSYIKLKSGEYLEPVMLTKERIDRISQRSKQAKNYSPTQGLDWEEFWKKAAIRNILKYAPRSTALDKTLDEMDAEFTYEEEEIPAAEEVKEEKPKTRAEKAVEKKQEAEVIDAEYVEEEQDMQEAPPFDEVEEVAP